MFLANPFSKEHQTGPGHPETPARFDAALRGLPVPPADIPPRAAPPEELALCHTPDYIETVARDILSHRHTLSTGDTDISPGSLDAARKAPGTVLNAVDRG